MPTSPSEGHYSEKADQLKNKLTTELVNDLDAALKLYTEQLTKSKLLPTSAPVNIKRAVMARIDSEIRSHEGDPKDVQNPRSEKILVQDVSTFMPFVRLAMLQELHTQMSERHIEGIDGLKIAITKLEGEIKRTTGELAIAKSAYESAKNSVDTGFQGLTTSPEYKALLSKSEDLGKSRGEDAAYTEALKQIKTVPDLKKATATLQNSQKSLNNFANTVGKVEVSVDNAVKNYANIFTGSAVTDFKKEVNTNIIPALTTIEGNASLTNNDISRVSGAAGAIESTIDGQITALNGNISDIDTSITELTTISQDPNLDANIKPDVTKRMQELTATRTAIDGQIKALTLQNAQIKKVMTDLTNIVSVNTTGVDIGAQKLALNTASTALLATLKTWETSNADGKKELANASKLLLTKNKISTQLKAQAGTLGIVIKDINQQGVVIADVITALERKQQQSQADIISNAAKQTAAELDYSTKIQALEQGVQVLGQKTEDMGKKEGALDTFNAQIKNRKNWIGKNETAKQQADTLTQGFVTDKEKLVAGTTIRINAQNLIVRTGPEKKAKPILDPKDPNKALMLQTGDTVKPVLDADGKALTYTDKSQKDNVRKYIQIYRPDNGEKAWIALSDKIGNGKIKQEYADVILSEDKKDDSKSYELKGEDIKLRTGFSKTADIIDVLDNKKIVDIKYVVNQNEGDNTPEGSGLTWQQVEVTYKDGTTKRGYIAEQYLTEK